VTRVRNTFERRFIGSIRNEKKERLNQNLESYGRKPSRGRGHIVVLQTCTGHNGLRYRRPRVGLSFVRIVIVLVVGLIRSVRVGRFGVLGAVEVVMNLVVLWADRHRYPAPIHGGRSCRAER